MWFLQKWISKGNMEESSHLDNQQQQQQQQQYPDLQLQSDPVIIDNDKLVQVLAQDIENLVLSCKDEALDRSLQTHSVVINEVDQAVDEDLLQFVKEDVNENGSEEQLVDPNHPMEVRVLEERETGESEIGCENHEEEDDDIVYEHRDGDLMEKHEIEVEDEDSNSENVGGDGWEEGSVAVGGDGWEEGSVAVMDDGKVKGYRYPLRLDAKDCLYCKFGSNCRFNHRLGRKNQSNKETKKQKEEKAERHGQTDRKPTKETKKQKEENVERHGQTECKPTKETKKQKEENVERHGQTGCKPTKETMKQKEENVERHGQTECKYHMSPAGCKYGKACKFNHGRGKTVKTPVVEYNFLGLPIRPGEKECPYYMRNGCCKHGPSCRFNHPDPTAVGGGDSPTTYANDGPLPPQSAPQPNISNRPSWSAPRTPDPTAAFVPMMYPPTQNIPPPNPDWNVYQAPAPVPAHLYPSSERGLPIPPAFFLNNPPNNTNMYTHHQQPMLVSEYPERPGLPDCGYFMKTGDCKYRALCKYNHPQSRNTRTLRDQNICTYFSRHGTCKYGSACKYDHPVNYNSNSNSNPARGGYDRSNGPGPVIQQSM